MIYYASLSLQNERLALLGALVHYFKGLFSSKCIFLFKKKMLTIQSLNIPFPIYFILLEICGYLIWGLW